MERVRSRERDYEKPMTFEYLDGVNRSFKAFIRDYRRAPVTVLEAEKLYRQSPEETLREIERFVKGCVPRGSG